MSTPAVLFLIFNRPDTTLRVMEAIARARPPRLYVAADGPRPDRPGDADLCARAREVIATVDWPCEVHTLLRAENLGCGQAVTSAIDWFFEHEEAGIILEDDTLPSTDFFPYCAELLERYRGDRRVMAVCGSSYVAPPHGQPASYYFAYYADIWGWATWRRAWHLYDRGLARWPAFKQAGKLDALAAGRPWHSAYWTFYFDAVQSGTLDTWDYPWIYTVIEQHGLACYPTRNLVTNIGWGSDATHTVLPPGVVHLAANMAHAPLAFPLVHPTEVVRSEDLEGRIESKRLGLDPPTSEAGGPWLLLLRRAARVARATLRRVSRHG